MAQAIDPELSNQRVEIFCSYSHTDEAFRVQIEKHLAPLRREGLIELWSDRRIGAGETWAHEIDSRLDMADIILLLISADFLASDYCMDIELTRALERHSRNEASVVPLIVRPANWEGSRFRSLQVLPPSAKPITQWENQDEAYRQIALGIRALIEKRTSRKRQGMGIPINIPGFRKETLRYRVVYAAVTFVTLLSLGAAILRFSAKPQVAHVRKNPAENQPYVWIPAGRAERGCRASQEKCEIDEGPARMITISNGYWLGQHSVTVGSYSEYSRKHGKKTPPPPPFEQDDNHPVVNVSWEEASHYCESVGGRLPSEAEWEYAARMGRNDLAEIYYSPGWYRNNSGGQTHPVDTEPPNQWRLFGLLGNVREWVGDWYAPDYYKTSPAVDPIGPLDGSLRVLRGGSWNDPADDVRITNRWTQYPAIRESVNGFRCVLEEIP